MGCFSRAAPPKEIITYKQLIANGLFDQKKSKNFLDTGITAL